MSSYDYRFEQYVLVAMHGLICSNEYAKKGPHALDPKECCEAAIQYAEELMKQLKERDRTKNQT